MFGFNFLPQQGRFFEEFVSPNELVKYAGDVPQLVAAVVTAGGASSSCITQSSGC